MKRTFDLIFAGLLLILLAPVLATVGMLILIFDDGPVFFSQDRPGRDGKIFKIIKFRTMKTVSKPSTDELRLTRFGAFMRSLSVDELPELINVIRGDMSLVGPRPLLPEYLARYTATENRRHEVRPGITGWAQVNGRNRLNWSEKFALDVWYVDHRSFILDLKILFATIFSVLKREGISAPGSVTMSEFNPAPIRLPDIEMSSAEITEVDIQAVTEVLRSGRLALGPKVIEFEKKVARYVGVKHAIAVSSGTSALHLIVKALGIGPGDEVLVPSFTFAASVNAILYEGAIPVFVDITADTYNMDPADLERKRTARTRAIMAVDVFGHPIEWDQVEEFALKHQLKIIDDSCEALGAEYDGRKIGSFGDAGAFAFYPNKQITTGEGGMIVTDNDEIAKLCRSFRNQGRDEMGQWLEHVRLGYNYRMDEMSGALGSSQMDRIELILSKRAEVAARYSERFSKVPGVHTPKVRSNVRMSWFVYVLTLDEGLSADQVIRGLLEHGIPSRAYFSPIHDQLYLKGAEWNRHKSDLPVTDAIASRTIALPFHANISVAQIDRVVAAFEKVLLSVRNSRSSVA